jgi:hypothetical protein
MILATLDLRKPRANKDRRRCGHGFEKGGIEVSRHVHAFGYRLAAEINGYEETDHLVQYCRDEAAMTDVFVSAHATAEREEGLELVDPVRRPGRLLIYLQHMNYGFLRVQGLGEEGVLPVRLRYPPRGCRCDCPLTTEVRRTPRNSGEVGMICVIGFSSFHPRCRGRCRTLYIEGLFNVMQVKHEITGGLFTNSRDAGNFHKIIQARV